MSTPGTLIIREKSGLKDDYIMLYTTHTAMDTLKWIREAPEKYALHRGQFLLDEKITKEEIIKKFNNNVYRGQFNDAPSVAALIIAARMDCYRPVPSAFLERYPEILVGTLIIHSDTKWVFKEGKKKGKIINPMNIALDALTSQL
jgi:hypothetical protein